MPLAAAAVELPVRVIDGDTLDLGEAPLRLFGIDAPERDQTCDRNGQSWQCGLWSARVLADALAAGPLACVERDRDRYGRSVATCTVNGRDLGALMVRAGAATAYRRYSDRYVRDEAEAKASGRGIWAGRMVTPEAHRRPVDPAPEFASGECTIKGNISASGRIYHLPGQQDYDATRISPARGEAWFCSEDEARAQGFRRARR